MSMSLNFSTFEADVGQCASCGKKDVFVAWDDYYHNCAVCLQNVVDKLNLLQKARAEGDKQS